MKQKTVIKDGDQFGVFIGGFSSEKEAKFYISEELENKGVFIVLNNGKKHSYVDNYQKAFDDKERLELLGYKNVKIEYQKIY